MEKGGLIMAANKLVIIIIMKVGNTFKIICP
jgi:hypothetical protein